MTNDERLKFFDRIDSLTLSHTAKFGKMSVDQMIPHCTDQLRMAFGTKAAEGDPKFSAEEVIKMARSGSSVPTPKGFDQVKEEGTAPTSFEADKEILKEHITRFYEAASDFEFHPHFYFGQKNKSGWEPLIKYHLNYHLSQFGA